MKYQEYLSGRLSEPIKRLICNKPLARAVYELARHEGWSEVQFLGELAVRFAEAHAAMMDAEVNRQMSAQQPRWYWAPPGYEESAKRLLGSVTMEKAE